MQIGKASRSIKGESVCGDQCVIVRTNSCTTIGIADGLGHGQKAYEAARDFCAFVANHAEWKIVDILAEAHNSISHTRGVAGVVLRIDEQNDTLQYVGVGNIEFQAASHSPIRPISYPGIVGKRIRKIMPFNYNLSRGDVLTAFSDGVSRRLDINSYKHLKVQDAAEKVIEIYGKDHDDALCIVIRYSKTQDGHHL
jgi:hypothetical protein